MSTVFEWTSIQELYKDWATDSSYKNHYWRYDKKNDKVVRYPFILQVSNGKYCVGIDDTNTYTFWNSFDEARVQAEIIKDE